VQNNTESLNHEALFRNAEDAAIVYTDKLIRSNTGLPIDVFALAKGEGIEVSQANFNNSDVLGQLEFKNKKIVISKKQSLSQALFTTAHEFGHYVEFKSMKDAERPIIGDVLFHHQQLSLFITSSNSIDEVKANAFALALLMPWRLMQKFMNQKDTIALSNLAKHFCISPSLVQHRLMMLSAMGKDLPEIL
jgi:Zn-dependent peptidase ImmA (M78 family)